MIFAEFLSDSAVAGYCKCGADIIDFGMAATPTVARNIARLDANAGIVVTASNNSSEDNGLKLWTHSGQIFGIDRRDRITEIIETDPFAFAAWDNLRARQDSDNLTRSTSGPLLRQLTTRWRRR